MLVCEVEVNISKDEFYFMLLSTITYDIYQKTKKKPTFTQLEEGYSYKTEVKEKKDDVRIARIRISAPTKGGEVLTVYDYGNYSYEMKYTITTIDDSHTKVVYTQTDSEITNGFINRLLINYNIKKRCKDFARYINMKKRKIAKEKSKEDK